MGDKLNHRRKNKEVREYKELDISQFDDIIKKSCNEIHPAAFYR